jgi:hypothetical protein
MDIERVAFTCCKADINDVFDSFSNAKKSEGEKLTLQAVKEAYKKYGNSLSEEQITKGFQRFTDNFCSSQTEIDSEKFSEAIEEFSRRLEAQGKDKAEKVLNRIAQICIDCAGGDPVAFANMLKLPSSLKLSEVKELMNLYKKR